MDKKKFSPEKEMEKKIKSDVDKKIKAESEKDDIMFGLGVFGIIGWAVSIPTLLGVLLGVYLDKNYPMNFSWTLTLLILGIVIGCLNAWHWINEKSKKD